MALEEFSKYCNVNFSYLNQNMSDLNKQKKYYQKYVEKYNSISKKNNRNDIILWDVRLRKSLKEIFTSAAFFVEGQYVYEQNCFTSYYFLMYYSLFHAMLATLFLDEKLTVEELMDINHSKVLNCFVSNHCTSKFPIIKSEIKYHFEILKYMREYYSYSMPMNEFFEEIEGLENPKKFIENDIKQCFQLANFLSVCLENSFVKHFQRVTKINQDSMYYLIELFKKVNGKPHPTRKGRHLIEYSDENALNERLTWGCQVAYLNLDLEHFTDEFRTYPGDLDKSENTINIAEIWNVVYSALE